jgi:hypothetical protein
MSRELDPDDHLVEPGTRCELFEGEIVYVPPARPGHGDAHSLLNTVIGHHAAPGYTARGPADPDRYCEDPLTLERWLLRATEVHAAAELLG